VRGSTPEPTKRPAHPGRRVLVVDDEESLRHMLQFLLRKEGFEPFGVADVDAALAELSRRAFDIVITDLRMPERGGMDLVDEVRRLHPGTTVVVMTAYGSRDIAIEALKRGAYDYISKPFEADELVLVLRKAEERERLSRENVTLRRQLAETGADVDAPANGIVVRSRPMLDVMRTVAKLAEFKTTVLVQGESGTGKELVARALHRMGPRAKGRFVAINCGAIPEHLLEAELFGYRRGAFTDAARDRRGLFEEADGGTLFLDEIGELPLALQVKLLRAVQEGEIRRLGDENATAVDVRVVAATARDLKAAVARGAFREDLFYRLNVVSLTLPALRERPEDIAPLVAHLVARLGERLGVHIESVTPEAMKMLVDAPWPGNVRELENTLERAMVLAEGHRIEAKSLPSLAAAPAPTAPASGELDLREAVRKTEEACIRAALTKTCGNRTRAAELLGISHRTLLYKLKEFDFATAIPGGSDES
jgi:two-component system response regulator AtoC